MNYGVTTYKKSKNIKCKEMQCTRRLRKEWSAKDATRTWICARFEKVTNQQLSCIGISVYYWFVCSRENLIARAKPYMENKRIHGDSEFAPLWENSADTRFKISRILQRHFVWYRALLIVLYWYVLCHFLGILVGLTSETCLSVQRQFNRFPLRVFCSFLPFVFVSFLQSHWEPKRTWWRKVRGLVETDRDVLHFGTIFSHVW